MAQTICIHGLAEIQASMLPDFRIGARTRTIGELRNAVGALECDVLILDLDDPSALNAIAAAIEIRPTLAVVGITGGQDLNALIAAQRGGCKQVTTRPLDENDLVVAVRRAVSDIRGETTSGQTIGLIGSTGGAGATTVACNLAVEIAAQTHAQTAIMDLDIEFGGVARAFDVQPAFTIAELTSAGAVDAVLLEKAAMKMPSGVHIFARPVRIEDGYGVDANSVRTVIRQAACTYPFLLLDLPRRLDPITGSAIEMCDRLLIVAQLTVPAIDNARRLIETLAAEGYAENRVGIVINRYRKNVHSVSVELAQQQLATATMGIIPSDYQSVNRAIDTGKPLEKKNAVRAAIGDIAKKLLDPDAGARTPKKGWLSSMGLGRRAGHVSAR